MDIKKIVLIYFLIVFGDLFSQKLSFEIKPSYNLLFGTCSVKRLTPENQIVFYDGLKNRIKFTQGSFAFDLKILEFKKIDFGISYYGGSAGKNLKFSYSYISTDSVSNPNVTSEMSTSQGGSTTIKQFGLYIQKDFKRKQLQHSFSFYTHFIIDKTHFLPYYDNLVLFQNGYLNYDYENYPELYQGKKGFSAMLRYDIEFLTKKDKNILNFFVAFQQGFTKMDVITLDVYHSQGFSLNAKALWRASFFAFGISKPIKIWKQKVK